MIHELRQLSHYLFSKSSNSYLIVPLIPVHNEFHQSLPKVLSVLPSLCVGAELGLGLLLLLAGGQAAGAAAATELIANKKNY